MSKSAQRVVFITGCSKGGIGFELCDAFAAHGCKVYASARRVETLEGFKHPGISRLTVDVTKEEDIREAVEFIIETEGRIDIVVSNAGTLCIGPVIDITLEQAKQAFDTNFFAAMTLARIVVPHMAVRKEGLIVTVGSVAGDIPTPFNGIYCASKAALHSLTETLSMELRPFNIKCALLIPAQVKSNIAQNHSTIFQLPPNSLYKSFLDRIVARMFMSQGDGSMDTRVYARQMVNKLLAKDTPTLWLRGGGNLWKFILLRWMPRWMALNLLWRWVGGK